jgi:hypothetical protein
MLALLLVIAPTTSARDAPMPRATHGLARFEDIRESPHPLSVRPAAKWTQLFHRQQGWTGADGIYSMPTDGHQAPGNPTPGPTLFTFGDTLIGSVDPDTSARRPGWRKANYSMAKLEGLAPDPARLRFAWGGIAKEMPLFRLSVPPLLMRRFWLQDGLILDGHYYSLAMGVASWSVDYPWYTRGTVLLKVPMNDAHPQWSYVSQRRGVYRRLRDPEVVVYFGAAFLENTREAGWKSPDGYLYIYGRWEAAERPFNPWIQRIELSVARTLPGEFENFEKWRFWTGSEWAKGIETAEPLGLGGPELSVTPIECGIFEGKYLLISKHPRSDLYYRVADAPQGPFGPPYRLVRTREEEQYGYPTYTYNAKAHPHLSRPGELLISYNVNDEVRVASDADIYRPRFLWLDYDPEGDCAKSAAP